MTDDTRKLRLITLGDSTLDSASYSGVTAPELLARDLGAELVHLAVDGATARDVLDAQLARIPPPRASTRDALVVSVGGNDLLYALAIGAGDDTRRFGAWISQILARARRALGGDPATVVANIYHPGEANVGALIANLHGGRARAEKLHASFNAAIAAAAAEHGAPLVDLARAFESAQRADGSHPWIVQRIEPSADGAREIARLLAAPLRERLEIPPRI